MKTYINRLFSSVTALSLIVSLISPATVLAVGAPVREFSASTTPTEIASPGTQEFTVTFTNDPTSTDDMKSGRVTLPTGFTLQNPPVPVLGGVTDWEVCSADTEIQFGTIGGATGVAPGDSLTLTFTAAVAASAGEHTFVARAFKNSSCNPGGGAEFGSNQTPIIVTVNNAPVANALSISTAYETATSSAVTATDADSDPLTYVVVSNPSHGVLSGFNAITGAFTYTPHNGHSGPDSFTFKANDGTIDSAVATVSITVNPSTPVNTAPVIVPNGTNPMSITLGTPYVEPGAVANDAEDGLGLLVSNITGAVNHLVVGAYHVLYNYTDLGGLSATEVDRTVNVTVGTTQCSDGADNDGDTDTDYPTDTGCESYADDSENQLPVITLVGADPQIVTLGTAYTELGATANDDEDGASALQPADINSTSVNTAVVGPYSVFYNFTDSDGAAAAEVVRAIEVKTACTDGIDNDEDGLVDSADTGCDSEDPSDNDENTPPVITLTLGASPYDTATVNLLTTDTYTELGATANDAEDSPEPAVVVGGDVVNTAVAGTYVITYNATDSDLAPAEQVTRTVNVSTAPIVPECSDDRDNDVDGLTDELDPGCWTNPNDSETYDANDNDESDPADFCSNINGFQASVPEGMTANNGVCTATPVTPPVEPRGGGGSSGGSRVTPAVAGQVLGESCGLYMDQYLKRNNSKNNPDQVTKLQAFLNKHAFGTFTPTGFFGPLTEAAVKVFQAKYSADILTPWGISAPTGLAYLTTIRTLNLIECPELMIPVPTLIEWSNNPAVR